MRGIYFLLAWQLIFIYGDDQVNSAAAVAAIDPSKVTFFLYNQANVAQQILVGDSTTVKSANFNASLHTYIFIHGYLSSYTKPPAQNVKDGILSAGNANVILVDYSPYSYPYRSLYNNSRSIGAVCGSLINFLVDSGDLQLPQLTIIGHSFGAHISAFTANNVKGRVKHIIGLDPAGPLFRGVEPQDRLNILSADYVVCIHTSPTLGIHQPICTVNYFANGGALQPSCGTTDDNELLFGTCSHLVAIAYFVQIQQSDTAFPTAYCPAFDAFSRESYCLRQSNSYMTTSYSNRPFPGSYYVRVPQ